MIAGTMIRGPPGGFPLAEYQDGGSGKDAPSPRCRMGKMMTVAEAAETAGVSESLVYGWISDGELPHYRLRQRPPRQDRYRRGGYWTRSCKRGKWLEGLLTASRRSRRLGRSRPLSRRRSCTFPLPEILQLPAHRHAGPPIRCA